MRNTNLGAAALLGLLAACGGPTAQEKRQAQADTPADTVGSAAQIVALPAPYATESATKRSVVIDWPAGKMPVAPAGFTVREYAGGFNSPRWLYVLPNGDVLVAESNTVPKSAKLKVAAALDLDKSRSLKSTSANRITLLRDTDKDGRPDVRTTFLSGLKQPLGMVLIGNNFYVANTDAVLRFAYAPDATSLSGPGQKILDLPEGGYNNHWTRNLLASADGSKIYVSVGSASNVMEHGAENEIRRANILEINPDGSGEKIYASGLRNPVGMAWAPGTTTLWTAVNERDELGDDLVPDYLTSVRPGGFYGWPYSYFGQHEDPRRKGEKPELVRKALVPEVALGPHTASLGLAFYSQTAFPAKYRGGAFIGQHGSWNRSQFTGYKVVFVPFRDGRPSGPPEDFLTGFRVDEASNKVYGRPVGVFAAPDGSLLVADDAGNKVWRVSAAAQ
ncbi:Glucose/arabinose dehydrogenase, beta-propeller fold [Hymenobacter daecheongensis DSM 21074]|uniref:Glucose/arabinose dehydrogenase, beta-propeller fold n=1 Tax=Hymenobacter daecheongensis DSM 21074 TaxID=1121955 RepID=A0A1M6DHF6_9BACT|nr:sorbosone dehydrogenase family protein [Hymenobacter daecheongensis]SHI72716.1 Glucose/arabinose dehydrogenase, beta-propeller fold [Hymenobacter daecheongensis DSM 21074]